MPVKLDYAWEYQRRGKTKPLPSKFPVISNIVVSLSGQTATIRWTTDVASTSQVIYATNLFPGTLTPRDNALVTSHSVVLTGLAFDTTYYFKVGSFNVDSETISPLNAFLMGSTPVFTAFILRSPDTTRWAVIVMTTGNLDSEVTPTGPAGAYEPAGIVMLDGTFNPWTLTISNSGNLITTAGGSAVGAISGLSLSDSGLRSWLMTVSILGNLVTT